MLRDKIGDDMRAAMKARDQVRVTTLRMLMTSMKNAQVEAGHELDDDEVVAVIGKEAKRRRESIDAYTEANRSDLADKEAAELEILATYLPEQLDEAAIGELVDEAIAEVGATSAKEMGQVMKAVMPKVKGRADGSAVSAVVKAKLTG